ncbi:MAG: CapA family protein [Patescibacteria group bacterium]
MLKKYYPWIVIGLTLVVVILSFIFIIYKNDCQNFAVSIPELLHREKAILIKDFKLPEIEPASVSLIAVGDVMLSRDADTFMKKLGGYDYPYLETASYLQSGDIVFGNLETPITPGRKITTEEMVFRADPENASALKKAGFTIMSLANNHIMNFGMNGFADTKKYLDEADIKYIADSERTDIEIKGMEFAFIAFAYNFSMNTDKLTWLVEEAKKQVDFVIVSMHAGTEYSATANTQQINFAHTAIDAGADLVLGHHPHVIQPIEKYKDKYIFYSLGNFVFDQMWSEETKKGLMAKINFTTSGVQDIELQAVYIKDYCRPGYSNKADSVYDRLQINMNMEKVMLWPEGMDNILEINRAFIK